MQIEITETPLRAEPEASQLSCRETTSCLLITNLLLLCHGTESLQLWGWLKAPTAAQRWDRTTLWIPPGDINQKRGNTAYADTQSLLINKYETFVNFFLRSTLRRQGADAAADVRVGLSHTTAPPQGISPQLPKHCPSRIPTRSYNTSESLITT